MGVWLMDCQSEILHNLLACFFFFTPPPHPRTCTMFKDLSRVLHVKRCSPLKPASFTYFFFLLPLQFMNWCSFSVCVCVFYFVWFFLILLLELAVLPPFFPTSTLTPSQTISSEMKEKKAKFFFLLLSSSCEIELAKEKKM